MIITIEKIETQLLSRARVGLDLIAFAGLMVQQFKLYNLKVHFFAFFQNVVKYAYFQFFLFFT